MATTHAVRERSLWIAVAAAAAIAAAMGVAGSRHHRLWVINPNELAAMRLMLDIDAAQDRLRDAAPALHRRGPPLWLRQIAAQLPHVERELAPDSPARQLPTLLAAAHGRSAGPLTLRHRGFCFRLYRPGPDGSWQAEATAGALPPLDPELADRWVLYAWPERVGRTGRRAFALIHDLEPDPDRLLATRYSEPGAWSADAAPPHPARTAFVGRPGLPPTQWPRADCAVDADGSYWAVYH